LSNSKKLVIVMLIVVTIIIAIIVFLLIYLNSGKIFYGIDEVGDNTPYIAEEKVKVVTNRNDFYTVENCINKYYVYYARNV
jgi:archaellum component FlaG (FlaF/FlaG flagellin family)